MEDSLTGNLGELLRAMFIANAQRPALFSGGEELTYDHLLIKSELIAEQLIEKGLENNEPVHILVSNQPSDIAAILGVWLAKGVIVPINRSSPEDVLLKIQRKTTARFQLDYGSLNESPEIQNLSIDRPLGAEILEGAAFVIFTSGTTGEPKGVVVSHDAFINKLHEIDKLLHFCSDDRVLLVLNINFVFGLWLALLTLLRGGELHLLEKFVPNEFISALVNKKISRVGVVPTMMRVIFSKPELVNEVGGKVNTGILRQILIGGESLGLSLAMAVRKQFSKSQLIDIYGSTETASCDFFSFPETFSLFPGSIGSPSGGVSYRIVDAKNELVQAGMEGELQISSAYVMKGYLDDSELTTKAFSGKWFKTGDIAREVGPKVLQLMGRSKELISRGGNKVSPGEIEQAICAHPAVAAALAVGIEDEILGERIHVLVIPNTSNQNTALNLKEHLKTRLEKYKIPDAFYISDALPVGRTGKADRSQFKSQILSGALVPTPQ